VKVFQFSLVLNDQVEEGNGSLGFQCCEARNAIYEEKRAANKNKSLKGKCLSMAQLSLGHQKGWQCCCKYII